MIKISIIVPIYNSEYYIERCIKSIINQSYSNLEIILIDDGSTNNSASICETYKNIDRRITFIKLEKNNGVGFARNIGLSKANGDFITFVDSDDHIDKDMYKNFVSYISTENISYILISGFKKNKK